MKTSIAGFGAELVPVGVADDVIALWRVANLERHVDREALLAGENPPEPPYWAHLWSGALVLAAAVPPAAGNVLEVGCGLGLPGLTAARRGARVTFVDRIPEALAFARASAAANGVASANFVVADFTTAVINTRFDLILAAEVLYDRNAFPAVAESLARHLAPTGTALLTDAHRTNTREFYEALAARNLRCSITKHALREEGLPVAIDLVEIRS